MYGPQDTVPCVYWGRLVPLQLLLALAHDPPPLLQLNLPSQVSLAFKRAGGDPRLLQNILRSQEEPGLGKTSLGPPRDGRDGRRGAAALREATARLCDSEELANPRIKGKICS